MHNHTSGRVIRRTGNQLLELGILFLSLSFLRTLELRIGVRENGPLYVFGQAAMFFANYARMLGKPRPRALPTPLPCSVNCMHA